MTRELKFRAWDGIEKKMHYGAFSVDSHGGILDAGWNDPNGAGWKDITIMQYTGLHNRNGKEIYEGDILKFAIYHAIGIVQYDERQFCYWISLVNRDYRARQEGSLFDFTTSIGWADSYEVIGNLYESPELVKSNA